MQKEKAYTKSQNDAGKINRNDFDAEFWMAENNEPRRRWMRGRGLLATAGASGRTGAARGKALAAGV